MTRSLKVGMPPRAEDERDLLPYLSAHTRQSWERGVRSELTTANWKDYARAHAATKALEKSNRLLDVFAARSRFPGKPVVIDTHIDYPLIDAAHSGEVNYFLGHLVERQLVAKVGKDYVLTVQGWQHVDSGAVSPGRPARCFVAMAFDPTLNEAYELGIVAAVRDCGLDPIRIDKVEHNEKICDRILAEIRRSHLLIADFTLHRSGVYFEAGFALALRIPVIFCCRTDELQRTHFDTRQYNHIVWESVEELAAKLADRIRATTAT